MSRQTRHSVGFLFLIAVMGVMASPAAAQIFRLSPADTVSGNYFGTDVAIDDSVAIVGASGDHQCGENAGAAFIYELDSHKQWKQSARLVPDDCKAGIFFGRIVAISGGRAAVVAFMPYFSGIESNAVYIFERQAQDHTWAQTATLRQPSGKREGIFATSLALDGDRLLITAGGGTKGGEDAGTETPAEDATDGAAYVYEYDGSSWNMTARLVGSLGRKAGVFGTSSALRGDRLVVSASTSVSGTPGSVYVFDRNPRTNKWEESGVLRGILDFFISVDVDGDRILVGESRAGPGNIGRARIFERGSGGKWRALQTLKPSANYTQGGFGSEVSLRGDHALVVGFDEQLQMNFNIDRVVYVFERAAETNHWKQKHIIDLGNVAFGSAIDLDETVAVIGQAPEDKPGNAYIVMIR